MFLLLFDEDFVLAASLRESIFWQVSFSLGDKISWEW